jgi:hypothetical protein
MSAVAFTRLAKGKHSAIKVFTASLTDINRALTVLKREKPKLTLLAELQEYAAMFKRKLANMLPPLRETGINHKIDLIPD